MCLARFKWTGLVNPARAGMILFRVGAASKYISKPRASGDDPAPQAHKDRSDP